MVPLHPFGMIRGLGIGKTYIAERCNSDVPLHMRGEKVKLLIITMMENVVTTEDPIFVINYWLGRKGIQHHCTFLCLWINSHVGSNEH